MLKVDLRNCNSNENDVKLCDTKFIYKDFSLKFRSLKYSRVKLYSVKVKVRKNVESSTQVPS